MFYVHAYASALSRAAWGWLTRGPDPSGAKVALWYGVEPVPGRYPGAWVEWYSTGPAFDRWRPDAGWRIVDAAGHRIVDGIPNEGAARDLLAWLCPAPQE